MRDVLKRHIECHPQYYKAKRDFVACTRCRESKTKCDEDSPCKPCRRRELHCVRTHGGETNVNAAGMVLESTPDTSSPSSSSVRGPEESKLREYVAKNRDTIERRLSVYFAGIHPSWPLLQPSMVTVSGSPDLLISTIVMLASWLEGDLDHLALYPLVFEEIMERQLGPNPPLPVLQAMALCTLYSICCVATEGIALKAFRVHSSLVTACRFAGIFAPQRRIQYTGEEQQEPESRLAFAVLRLDAYLTAILDFPPMVRYQELSMPLSQTTCWIPVASEEERRRLLEDEHSMRKKTSFCARVHDMFGTPRPNLFASRWTRMDYHFILCAIQSGAWEACHQVFRSVPDDIYSRTHPQDLRDFWRECLRTWASGLETDCQVSTETLRQDYFTTPYGDDISPQTLLLWHMTNIKLRTPPDLWELQGRYFNISAVNTRLRQSLASAIRPWQSSKVARLAVWHSAQIARIASHELSPENSSTRIRLNPILIPSLLMSAILILAIASDSESG
ncbi:hypothetical protein NUW58_g4749 [Xylaria curta]|uniref:Uncharacterized protein n=1 Tax=Xylaria curta TaxID=42375 RepID=A0ACC1P6B1_9PEZI|nr:hypothetical protein NUW58_g4749 [Xylaria curta]